MEGRIFSARTEGELLPRNATFVLLAVEVGIDCDPVRSFKGQDKGMAGMSVADNLARRYLDRWCSSDDCIRILGRVARISAWQHTRCIGVNFRHTDLRIRSHLVLQGANYPAAVGLQSMEYAVRQRGVGSRKLSPTGLGSFLQANSGASCQKTWDHKRS